MKYSVLGRTGIRVSRLCFGVLTMGPLQANLPLAEGVELLKYAVEQGVNFFDTAEIYDSYSYLRQLRKAVKGKELVIATKSYAVTAEEMAQSLEKARYELDRDYIDIFLLHEQESALTIKGHRAALDYLLEAKEKGLVRAVGISTHKVAGARGALELPEIDVIHPLFNIQGLGIKDGSIEEMESVLTAAAAAGKGIYLMKALGGGNLLPQAEKALNFAFNRPFAAAVAVGMRTTQEIDINVRFASGLPVNAALKQNVSLVKRKLHIDPWCEGCGECAAHCPQGALYLGAEGKMQVQEEECLLCGYCAAACPFFYIKVY
jgi:aryl-alcohol dehydrogenase-like predicted oxidoreductase/NAD-dependent dihydropyrimidine dehydrogenase PreA subunit